MKDKCKKISFNVHTKEESKYILSYILENQSLPSPDEIITRQQLNKTLLERMGRLPLRYQNILCMYFGINKEEKNFTYKEIGDFYGIKGNRIHQIVHNALNYLRRPHHSKYLRVFL